MVIEGRCIWNKTFLLGSTVWNNNVSIFFLQQDVYLFLLCGELDNDIWTNSSGRILKDIGEKVQCLSSMKNVNSRVCPLVVLVCPLVGYIFVEQFSKQEISITICG